jgi:hypothetical protein
LKTQITTTTTDPGSKRDPLTTTQTPKKFKTNRHGNQQKHEHSRKTTITVTTFLKHWFIK